MNFDQFDAFRTIAHKRSISQAARELYVSQQTLSRTLKQLETELGVTLFDRNGKKLELNKSGEMLLHYADITKNAIDTAEDLIAQRRIVRSRSVRVVFRTPIGNCASALAKFAYENPEAKVHIATDAEVHDDYDVEVFASAEDIADDDVTKVCEDSLTLILSSTHPLAQAGKPVDVSQLRTGQFVGYQPWGHNEDFAHLCKQAGFLPTYVMASQQVWSILDYASLGYLCVGPCVTWLNSGREDLTALPIKGLDSSAWIYVRLVQPVQSATAGALAKHLRDHFVASRYRLERTLAHA